MAADRVVAMPRRGEALPPFDAAAEEAVIAAILLDDDALYAVMDILHPQDFFREHHGWCYEAAIALADRGEAVTIPTLAHELDRRGQLDKAGGEPWLVEVAGKYFTALGVEAHARIVARDATYRRLIAAAQQIAQLAWAGGPDLERALGAARALVEGVESPMLANSVVHVGAIVEQIQADAGDDARRVTTGYRRLDEYMRGLAPGQLTVVGARTDQGKTSLLAGMALRQAQQGVPVFYIPLEGTATDVAIKLADALLGRSWDYGTKNGWGTDPAVYSAERWREAMRSLDIWPVHFPSPGRTPSTIEDLVTEVAMAARRFGCRVVYIDHIDALPPRRTPGQSDASVYAGWMRELQSAAVRLGVHIVVASQVNREADRTGKNPPPMHLLKESGAKEQAAQNVLMVGLSQGEEEINGKRGRWMLARLDKVKGYPFDREVRIASYPALWLDLESGAVRGVDEA